MMQRHGRYAVAFFLATRGASRDAQKRLTRNAIAQRRAPSKTIRAASDARVTSSEASLQRVAAIACSGPHAMSTKVLVSSE